MNVGNPLFVVENIVLYFGRHGNHKLSHIHVHAWLPSSSSLLYIPTLFTTWSGRPTTVFDPHTRHLPYAQNKWQDPLAGT
jgi:hypothetical protein